MKIPLLPGLLALLLPLAAQAGSQELRRTAKGHLATQVRIAGHGEQLFVVDTGASESAVYAHARARIFFKGGFQKGERALNFRCSKIFEALRRSSKTIRIRPGLRPPPC